MTFTRMDESTTAEWQQIWSRPWSIEQGMADRVLAMLASLEDLTVGFAVDQLVHSLQTATRAEEAGRLDRGRRGLAVPRHRQDRLGDEPPPDGGRDPAALRQRRTPTR